MSTTVGSKSSDVIDESLYSRQLYVMGHEAQRRMASSSVLITGLNGLGVETAKNIILMGVRSVTLYDNKVTTYEDLSAQFYLSESDIGQNRAKSSVSKLSELNPYVNVSLAEGVLIDVVKAGGYNVVVLIDQTFDVQQIIADYCHAHNIAVLIGDARGVFGTIFCDFGDAFTVFDKDGEQPASAMIAGITRDFKGLVTVLEETRHNLTTGDVVMLSDIVGMTELNGQSFPIEVKDPFSFEIDFDTRGCQPYINGGYVNQVKQPVNVSFKPFSASISEPGELVCDFVKMDHAMVLHLTFQALHRFVNLKGKLPSPGDPHDAQELFNAVQSLNEDMKNERGSSLLSKQDIDDHERLIKRFAMCCAGVISPVCALMGGVLGQEVLKACSGKFMPIRQWFYFDAVEALHDEPLPVQEVTPIGCRYDGQIMVFGREMQAKIASLEMFLVGAGAIGCEMLKNWALMGVSSDFPGAPKRGTVHVTDMDQIEKSNLSRQFLFRNTDINQPKSTTAVRAANRMNPSFRGIAYEQKVATDTEHIFNDDFYEGLDVVCTALDNVEARLYIDQKCLFYRKPMLESGTLGAKGHTQIVAPGKTEHYGATRDPPEKSIPVCTLKHFPNQIEHTLQWAREWFEDVFKQAPEDVNQYINNNDYLAQLEHQQNMRLDTLKRLKQSLVDQRPQSYEDCIAWGRQCFEELFVNRIKQLLHNFPLDRLTSSGTPFWSGAKKPPTALEFNPSDPMHIEFILSTANMRADIYGIIIKQDVKHAMDFAQSVRVEQFKPAEGVKIAATDEEAKAENENRRVAESSSDLDAVCREIIASLPSASLLRGSFQLKPIDFDKDIDAQMRVVMAASNLRARNYRIPEADLHTSRGIAGKITPAIATTTAMVTGAICLELYKILQDKAAKYLMNTFANLAIPLFTSMEPEPPKTTKAIIRGKEWLWTQWDCIDIKDPSMTVDGLISFLDEQYGVEMTMLSSGVTILFSDFMDRKKKQVSFITFFIVFS